MKYTGSESLTDILNTIKDGLEKGKQNVIFIGIRSVDNKLPENPVVYIKLGVQTISNGENFTLFRNILLKLGYDVQTNEYMTVLSVSY